MSLPRAAFVIPGDLGLPTGGYGYDRRVISLLPDCGVDVRHLGLPGSYPYPTTADLEVTRGAIAATSPQEVLLIDGLAYGAMPASLIRSFDRRIVALVHHPLCLEAGIEPSRAAELRQSEVEALALANRVLTTSAVVARTLVSDFAVPEDRITVAEPGTDPARRARGSSNPVQLLAVGSIIPRKAYGLLIEALAPLKSLPWRLDIAGSLQLSSETVASLRAVVAEKGLADRVRLLGSVDQQELDALYDQCDLFVLSSLYEGYGMVLTEALARGLPIVCTVGGAAADTLPDDACMKVQPGDARVLMWTLGRAIEGADVRKRVGDAAWAAAQNLPRWPDTARRVADAIKEAAR